MNLKKLFLDHCENNEYEINQSQLYIIKYLTEYYKSNFNQNLFNKILNKKPYKLGFYLLLFQIRIFPENYILKHLTPQPQ